MNQPLSQPNQGQYHHAMGQLLVLYTQVDRLIMEICAERVAHAPDLVAQLALAKQTGDESRHVSIQREWMQRFGIEQDALIPPHQEEAIRAHFATLPWNEFLTDLYVCVEALGSEAVERIVPLCDPGTKESLRIPLQDELDHVAFGMGRLREELSKLSEQDRVRFLDKIPARVEGLTRAFHAMGTNVQELFEMIGVDYPQLCRQVLERRKELLATLAA